MDLLTQTLAGLSIKPVASIAHDNATSPAEWKDALAASSSAPADYDLVKTLVYKPKTAKNATPVPIVIISAAGVETGSAVVGAVGKRLGVKELRLASPDLLQEFFGVDKDSLSPFSLNSTNFSKVVTVVDSSIYSPSQSVFGVHANSSKETLFVSPQDITAYLNTLKSDTTTLQELNLALIAEDLASGAPAKAAPAPKEKKDDGKIEGAVQIAIGVKKDVDFPAWYTSVLLKADMIDYYNVSGCYILRPWSFSIWEQIQKWFDAEIKELDVQNSYFPMFLSAKVLEREKDHIEGFSPEVAWVTRAGQSELEEPIAIRPTSETVMYPYYAKWIQSYRDLPLKLNQWCSVVRWEFKNPQPFLRTREFLWQEGHTAHLHKEDADVEVRQILDLYRRVYEELLAVPVIPGIKSVKEKFAGGLYTTTIEGFIPTSGRGIQAATSHALGQNFSRPEMFDITVEDPKDSSKKLHVWQNSWGLSTRSIGVMVMTHGDDQGLVLPPRVASVQVVVVPCGITAKTKDTVSDACDALAKTLKKAGIRAKADLRDGYTPGYKFNDWEQKGVPIRLEIGPKDIEKNQTLSVRRDTGAKAPIPTENLAASVNELLDTIQKDMFAKAKGAYDERLKEVTKWEDLVPTLDNKCVAVMPWCEEEACEDDIKDRSAAASEAVDERAPSAGAKSLAIPFDQSRWPAIEPGKTKCTACGKDAKSWTMFGRSY